MFNDYREVLCRKFESHKWCKLPDSIKSKRCGKSVNDPVVY